MTLKAVDNRHLAALDELFGKTPRKAFLRSNNAVQVSGHSTPPEAIARHLLDPFVRQHGQKLLHIGTGSGYLTALLSRCARQVVTIERISTLADMAAAHFSELDLDNITVRVGNGEHGDPQQAPYNGILVSTPSLEYKNELLRQLAPHGFLVALEGGSGQQYVVAQYTRSDNEQFDRRELTVVDFSSKTGDVLLRLGLVKADQLAAAERQAQASNRPLLECVRPAIALDDNDLYLRLAAEHNLPLADVDSLINRASPRLFKCFAPTFLNRHRLIPLSSDNNVLQVVTDDPDASASELHAMYPCDGTEKILVTPTDFRRLWSTLALSHDDSAATVAAPAKETQKEKDLLDQEPSYQAHLVSLFEALLLDAVSENASDIHIEIYGQRVRVRLRIDGELRDLTHYKINREELAGLVNVIKLRANLNIAERRLPQGGRFRTRVSNKVFDLRVQTQPSLHGEHIVMRLLRQTDNISSVETLGFSAPIARQYKRLLNNPAGLVLVVGPTGSGKSTTLYAGLQLLAQDGRRKVITVEDPVEYSIDNIQQTAVRNEIGFHFADAMRAFVREDPDVILVGEIRDHETALEAIRASQTGHVVLSTLHSNDAVDALQRIYDLNVSPNSIASELLAVIAQHLAKRICPHCRNEARPDPSILAELFPGGAPDSFRCFEGKGCDRCDGLGTRGRVAVAEFMLINPDIRDAIARRASMGELRAIALDAGLISMRDSALDHVIQGTIPMSELPRILPAERMAPERRGG